jgi:hypothetical protein
VQIFFLVSTAPRRFRVARRAQTPAVQKSPLFTAAGGFAHREFLLTVLTVQNRAF